MGKNVITAKILTGRSKGQTTLLPRIKLEPTQQRFPFRMVRTQFPLMPAFSMTINKSQGQSFSKVGVSLTNPVFAHGQLYVALSRAQSSKGLKIFVKESSVQGSFGNDFGIVYTRNLVYREVIQTSSNKP